MVKAKTAVVVVTVAVVAVEVVVVVAVAAIEVVVVVAITTIAATATAGRPVAALFMPVSASPPVQAWVASNGAEVSKSLVPERPGSRARLLEPSSRVMAASPF